MGSWTAADIPSQAGRTVVVTGANSGIGLAAAREPARAGAHVVLAVRDTGKGADAAQAIGGSTEVRALDLADLASVRAFAAALDRPVDVLVNNAGLMAVPEQRTADGFEMQPGTNFLGHFALTGPQRGFVAAGSLRRSVAAHPGYAATNLQSRTQTVADLPGGAIVGPDGPGELRGAPRPVGSGAASHDRDVARALWERAADLTGVHPDVAAPSP